VVDVIDQNGSRYAADDYPLASSTAIRAGGNGTLQLVGTGGAGPLTLPAGIADLLGPFVSRITPTEAANALNVVIPAPTRPSLVVGTPELSLTYTGTVSPGTKPTRIFAQLVDNTSHLVLGNQITPIDVTLDGQTHTTSVPLEIVSQSMNAQDSLTLQLVASTVAYATPQLGGTVTFDNVQIALPVAYHPVMG
jgi:ABC-2 type transport system ATP-binding protein